MRSRNSPGARLARLRPSVRRGFAVGAMPFRGSVRSGFGRRCETAVACRCGALRAVFAVRRTGRHRVDAPLPERAGVPRGAALRSTARSAQPKLAWSESSASTSVPVLPDARITTAGPIAPDGLRRESAPSRRGQRQGTESEGEFPPGAAGGDPRHTSPSGLGALSVGASGRCEASFARRCDVPVDGRCDAAARGRCDVARAGRCDVVHRRCKTSVACSCGARVGSIVAPTGTTDRVGAPLP